MGKILLLGIALTMCAALGAQTTAKDFNKNDCAGGNHHLFAELDSGYVCILDFVMMDCQPCDVASEALKTIHNQFQTSNPGKVRYYSIGFQNSLSCPQITNWATIHNFNHTVFDGDASQVSYYGGMGMPTIVIVGGLSQHKVYYKHQGYSSSQNTPITDAITLAISESSSGTNELLDKEHFNAFPNPFTNTLTVQLTDVSATHISLADLVGKEVLRQEVHTGPGSTEMRLPTENLSPGWYLLSLYNGERCIGLQKLIRE